jgi:hypothetical protein
MKKIWSLLLIVAVLALGLASLGFAEAAGTRTNVTLTATNVTSTTTALLGSNLPCSKMQISNPDPTYVVFVTMAPNTYTADAQYFVPVPPNKILTIDQYNDGTNYVYAKVSPTPKTIATGFISDKRSSRYRDF